MDIAADGANIFLFEAIYGKQSKAGILQERICRRQEYEHVSKKGITREPT